MTYTPTTTAGTAHEKVELPRPAAKRILSEPYILMVMAAFLARLAYVLVARTYHFDLVPIDPGPKSTCDAHFAFAFEIGSIARSIAVGHGFASPFGGDTGPSAWIGPVYPYLLAGIFRMFGLFSDASGFAIQLLGSAFSALTCIGIYKIGCRTVGRTAALWAGWVWALCPFFWRWSSGKFIWDSPLSALLMSAIFLVALDLASDDDWRRWMRFGLLWGFAALANPSLLSFLPASILWPAYRLYRSDKRYFKPLMVAGVAVLVTIAPWLIRNRFVFGHFEFIRDNLPFELHLSNYHYSIGMGWVGMHPSQNRLERDQYVRLGETGYIAAKKKEFLQFLREHPREFGLLTGQRFLAFWDGGQLRYSFGDPWKPWMVLLESVLALYGLVVAVSRRVHGSALFFALLVFYPLTYYVTAPSPRYRYAIEPLMLLLAFYFILQTICNFRIKLSNIFNSTHC